MQNSQNKRGLSSGNSKLLVGIFFGFLLLFGPIDPFGIVGRTVYVIALPCLLWFSLNYFGSKWNAGKIENDRLTRGVVAILAGMLFMGSFFSYAKNYHSECTQSARTGDGGYECVGDYVTAPGPDISGTIILGAFGTIAALFALSKHNED